MKIIIEAKTFVGDWYVQFSVEWNRAQLPKKGDMISLEGFFPQQEDALQFYPKKEINIERKSFSATDIGGYLIDYHEEINTGQRKAQYSGGKLIKLVLKQPFIQIVDSLIWIKQENEILLLISLMEI